MPEVSEAATRVVALARADDAVGVAAELRGLSEAERRAVWRALKDTSLVTAAAAVAALGCAPGAKSAADAAWSPRLAAALVPVAAQVLTDRRPTWLERLAVRLVDGEAGSPWGFGVVRSLIRAGTMEAPDDLSYTLAMVWGVAPWTSGTAMTTTPLSGLRADPALLERELWDLLGTERAGRRLANHDGWRLRDTPTPGREPRPPRPDATWRHALVTLAAEGTVDRPRLLDAALQAMLADWAAADVGWFVELHDALAPTSSEVAARVTTYLRLPASEIGPVVQVGLRAASRLLDSATAEPTAVARALEPALLRPQKGTALAALTLLDRIVGDAPWARREVGGAARAGLQHPRADVRDKARDLVGRCEPTGPATTAEHEPVAPRPRADEAPAASTVVSRAPEAVTPVSGAEELAELLAHLVEEADDPVGVERALDGVLRFRRDRPASARALAARAAQRVTELFPGPWSGQEIRADLAVLTSVWLGTGHPGPGYPGRVVGHDFRRLSASSYSSSEIRQPDWTLAALLTMRVHEVARAVRHGAGGRLLSLPTTADGSLSAAVLNERLSGDRDSDQRPLDRELALLRVPPGERGALRLPARARLLRRGPGAAAEALALLDAAAPSWVRVVGPTTGEYSSRDPGRVITWADPRSPVGAPDRLVAAVLDRREPLGRAGLESADGEYAERPEQATATWPLMLPHHVDHLAAHAHPRLARALTKNRSGAVPILQAIGRSPSPGSGPTASALALGLAAKETAARVAAVDAFIARAGRSLVGPAVLAEQVRACLEDGMVVGSRVVDGLAEAARADRASAVAALDVLVGVLDAVPGRRDAHRWVELVADLSAELDRPVRLPAPLRELAVGRDTSVLSRACRRVRAVG